jgi:hypothetical protein
MKLGKRIIGFVVCVGIVMLGLAPAQAQGNGKRLVLNLVGEGTSEAMDVPDLDSPGSTTMAFCYEVDLFNAKNKKLIGTATDCLSNFTLPSGGVALVGTTTFKLPQGNIVTQGRTTVQAAVTTPLPTTTEGVPITHITGASAAGNSIIGGTKKYENATGTVRLSGLVNLDNFVPVIGDKVFFDCLFVIDLD